MTTSTTTTTTKTANGRAGGSIKEAAAAATVVDVTSHRNCAIKPEDAAEQPNGSYASKIMKARGRLGSCVCVRVCRHMCTTDYCFIRFGD